MMMTNAKKRAKRVSACSTLNNVMSRQYTENRTITEVMTAFGTPCQMRVFDSRSYLRMTSSTLTSSLEGTTVSSFLTSLFFLMFILSVPNMLIALLKGDDLHMLWVRGAFLQRYAAKTHLAHKALSAKAGSQRYSLRPWLCALPLKRTACLLGD